MSGITGLYYLDGRAVQRRDLLRMTQILAHRGPDGSGVWVDSDVGLGHCLLRSMPESRREGAPLLNEAGLLVLTADARIDNREDLIRSLGWGDRPATEISDGALILGTYARWGERCPEYLLGDFAFALWDARTKRLFCARDHLGLKPFYYVHSKVAFAFASEIKALLALSGVARRPNEIRVADYLMQMTQDKEATFYEGVLRLPPAHTLTVSPRGVRLQQYWALDAHREIHFSSDAEYAESFRELFTDAVRCRLRSAFPVGSLLSGGLDSSSVTCVARVLLEANAEQPLDTFSLIFDEVPQCDERPYIEAVLAQGGLRPHYVHGDQVHPLDDLDRMLWHVDEPFFTPNLFLNWNLYRSAQHHGVRIVLDGFLGDNVVSHGSRYITELAARGRWIKLAREVHTIAGLLGSRRKGYRRILRQYVLAPLVKEPLQRAWAVLTKPELPAFPGSRFINADFARRLRWMERARTFGEDAPRTPRLARQEHYVDLTSGLLPGALEIANKAAAAFGITPCFPFTDRRLMEYCLAVPPTQKYQEGWTRVIARRGLRDYLPEKIHRRYGKTYMHLNFNRSLFVLAQEELNTFVFDRLLIATAYVNVEAIQQAYRQVLQHQGRPHVSQEVSAPIWRAVMLTRWLEREKDTISGTESPPTRDALRVETVTDASRSLPTKKA